MTAARKITVYERCKLALELKRLKTPVLNYSNSFPVRRLRDFVVNVSEDPCSYIEGAAEVLVKLWARLIIIFRAFKPRNHLFF